jgi:DNA invertase Pin-like site-specific DNA recombinase
MKYFIYARKSTESEDRQKLSISAQHAELKEFAAKEKLEIVASFQEAKTAKEPGRTGFAKMIKQIKEGKAQGILAWHPDRLARNSIDGGKIVYLLDTGKLKDLKFPTFWFDNTPQGKFMLNIAFGQSKYYVDNLSQNIKRGIRQKLRKGLWPSFAPIGYLNNKKTKGIDIDLEKAPLIKKAFRLYSDGEHTFKLVAKFLEKEGLRSYKGAVLSVSCVRRMLRNPIYYGAIRWKNEIYQGVHEPIISKKLFDKVQQVLSDRGKKKRKRQHDYAFTGFMKCGNCGYSITAERQKGHIYYRCTKKGGNCPEKYLREENLVNQLKKVIQKVSLSSDWTGKMLAELDREKVNNQELLEPKIQKLEKQKQAFDKKLDRLLDLQLEGGLSVEDYKQKKNGLMSKKTTTEEKIQEIKEEVNNWLEPMKEFILASCQAKKLLEKENNEEYLSFFKNIGSNFILKDKKF